MASFGSNVADWDKLYVDQNRIVDGFDKPLLDDLEVLINVTIQLADSDLIYWRPMMNCGSLRISAASDGTSPCYFEK
jgi:hypothetical protein